ncbi:MAG: pitrilysin family protein [Candidatus Omnitrophota bacterium]
MYKKTLLHNGLRIVSHPMPRMQSVAIGLWIKVGGRYESDRNKGISHFLEHLLFKGSKKFSYRKIKESIEGVGGSLNGFTSEEVTCYLAKIPARHIEIALDVLSDMVLNPLLPAQEIEKERTVILEEIKMYKDQPQIYIYELLDELLWPGQPLGAPVIGTVDSVSRIKKEDIRSFKSRFYVPANIIISAAGSLRHEKLVRMAQRTFSRAEEDSLNSFEKAQERQKAPSLKIFYKETEQTHMALGFHSLKRGHPLKHALGILNIVLGANMSSRLFNEIREKRGLAYEIATLVKRYLDTGAFLVHAGIDNSKVQEATRLILKELRICKKELISMGEFRRAKEFYLGQLMLALEDTLDHMLWIGECTMCLDRTYSLGDIIDEVRKVKREDVRLVARAIFQERKLNMALIGPLKDSHNKIHKELRID